MVKFFVEYEKEVEEFTGSGQLSKFMPTIKQRFNIEQSRRCTLKIKDEKKALVSTNQIQDQIERDAVLTLFAGKAVAKKKKNNPKINFTVNYADETLELEESISARVDGIVRKAKEAFGIDKKDRCQLKLQETALIPKLTLAENNIIDDSELNLVVVREYVEDEGVEDEGVEVQISGVELTICSNKPIFVRIATQMDLYTILKKVSKTERQASKQPLEFVLYIGTSVDYLIRFDDHCKPKAKNSRRTVFNKDEHQVVLVQRFTEDDFDRRFESPEHSALAYELLSDRLRKNCSFVPNWGPGVNSASINAFLVSKFDDNDIIAFATHLIKVIRDHD